jgi:hypothetical protein
LQEYDTFFCVRGGKFPLHEHVASYRAGTKYIVLKHVAVEQEACYVDTEHAATLCTSSDWNNVSHTQYHASSNVAGWETLQVYLPWEIKIYLPQLVFFEAYINSKKS